MKKTYYVANDEHIDEIYGSEYPICITMLEIKYLAHMWQMSVSDIMSKMHVATAQEIAAYGTCDYAD